MFVTHLQAIMTPLLNVAPQWSHDFILQSHTWSHASGAMRDVEPL